METAQPTAYDGKILVPFPVESDLSGVQSSLEPDQTLWYHRTFLLPSSWANDQVLLHFGAVDFECRVWVNGREVGTHRGGYCAFSYNITQSLVEGENEIVVSVSDPTDSALQERGKQVLSPKGIWYTAVSGIWQTVWLEPVPECFIRNIRITPDVDESEFRIEVDISTLNHESGTEVEIWLRDQSQTVDKIICLVDQEAYLKVSDPNLWSPENPHLYDLEIALLQGGRTIDQVTTYAAMRKFHLMRDTQGYLRFALNNQPLFLYGPLDQGYFPDGLYTSPNEEAMLFDIQTAKDLGCDMIRKHVKVEPARWYAHCDRLGIIVWQDMPNGGLPDQPLQATFSMLFGYPRSDWRRLGRFGRSDPANRELFTEQLKDMIGQLYHFPCIAVWVPFNESWGQFDAKRIAKWVKDLDPSRLVDHASGWFDQGGGDFISKHVYVKKIKSPNKRHLRDRAFVISEFGGYSMQIEDHVWDADKKFGYKFFQDHKSLTSAYVDLLEEQLVPLIPRGLAAAIYTQTTDVEIEVNGFLTYDRAVEKMDFDEIKEVHGRLKL
jgi:beta-galactosidase/beta-glucuronidase